MRYLVLVMVMFAMISCKKESSQTQETHKTADNKEASVKYGMANSFQNSLGGLEVDDVAPEFNLQADDGSIFRLPNELTKGPIVMIFYRGEWCPHCDKHLSEISSGVEQIREKGAQIVAISLETKENAMKMKEKSGVDFPLLRDPIKRTAMAYKVLFEVDGKYNEKLRKSNIDLVEANADVLKVPYLVVPATYIIGKSGFIEYVHYDHDYTTRASLQDILDNIPEPKVRDKDKD